MEVFLWGWWRGEPALAFLALGLLTGAFSGLVEEEEEARDRGPALAEIEDGKGRERGLAGPTGHLGSTGAQTREQEAGWGGRPAMGVGHS